MIRVDFEKSFFELKLTNYEVRQMFEEMIPGWFYADDSSYNDFIRSLLLGDLDAMNEYMNRVTAAVFSSFDTGTHPSRTEPERFHSVEATTKRLIEPNASVCFYHGFVLGLIVELRGRYVITSNRESGFGRYDVVLQPRWRRSRKDSMTGAWSNRALRRSASAGMDLRLRGSRY